jgi:hypothetical protein
MKHFIVYKVSARHARADYYVNDEVEGQNRSMKDVYHIRPFRFLMWWIACSLFVYPLTIMALGVVLLPLGLIGQAIIPYEVYSSDAFDFLIVFFGIAVIGGIIGASVALLQRWLLRTKLFWAADSWRKWSIAGGIIGAYAFALMTFITEQVLPYYVSEDWMMALAMPVFVLCLSALQWMALRHAVKQAWLWVLGNAIAGVVFSGLLFRNIPTYDDGLMTIAIFFLAMIVQGVITGYVLLFLFEKKLLPMTPEGHEEITDSPKSVWDDAI